MYVIRIVKSKDPCWYSGGDGDPGRTLSLASAKKFKCKSEVKRVVCQLRGQYPNRNYRIEEVPSV